ncbi:nitroreductase [Prauserella marina]|uniref:Nitroreductase n=1 Tax=Prauserella marina TaxID=530584 RepID=A0A222VWZ9_9PSEU|nr:nitroreductase family protein [Prauserella marina]ASR38434.1 nitroreductase [Prauserella marina]PWV78329.1 nitroreductase [Prauserella marina]SDC83549.1 Nitroreductase [Prauserella marina]
MNDKAAETSAPIHDIIATRWSPRALDESAEVSEEQLRALLEAARWAPSFGNTQPARYLVGRRGDDTFRRILATLTTSNQSWAGRASALLIGVAVTHNEKGEIPYAEYGLGLAGENLVLQAVAENLVAHQMAGFDPDAARDAFEIPEGTRPVIAIAVGVLAEPEVLGEQRAIEREAAVRKRVPLHEFAFTGTWGRPAFEAG